MQYFASMNLMVPGLKMHQDICGCRYDMVIHRPPLTPPSLTAAPSDLPGGAHHLGKALCNLGPEGERPNPRVANPQPLWLEFET